MGWRVSGGGAEDRGPDWRRRAAVVAVAWALSACTVTSRPTRVVEVGVPASLALIRSSLEAKGPLQFEKVVAADWVVDRGGLIDLDDPVARAAGLSDDEEAIQIYFYVITHPTHGRYLVDTGMETRLKQAPETSPIRGLLAKLAKFDKAVIHKTTREWLDEHPGPIKGVFLTHMHLDHMMGVPDIDPAIPLLVGPEESTYRLLKNLFVRGTADELLAGERTLSELRFPGSSKPEEPAVLDFFGDGSLFVLSVPGHTTGSLAFVVNAQSGPQLIVGDTCHTRWGWEQAVPPGGFSQNIAQNRQSLAALKALAQSIPALQVHLGHQSATAEGKLEAY